MKKLVTIVGCVLVLLAPATALSCAAGIAYEKEIGHFKAKMNYDTFRINPEQDVRFHFYLNNIDARGYGPGNPIDYNYVHVTLRDGDTVLTEQRIERVNFSETAFNYVVPDKHYTYLMDITYVKDDEILAELSLPIKVGRGNFWQQLLSFGSPYASLMEGVTVRRQQ